MRALVQLSTVALTTFVALVGCSSPGASGKLVDVINGNAPIADMRLIAEASGSASLSCSTFEATTDANGAFKFEGLCGGTPYKLKPGNENLWLAETDEIPDGGGENIEIKAWRAPKGSGTYVLEGTELKAIKTSADIKKEPLWKSESEFAEYPATLPKSPALIPADGYLVLVGDRAVDQTKFWPLIASGERKFGSPTTTKITMDPWSYIGISFTDDETFERKTAELDESKIVKKDGEERKVAWIPGSALPAGRYAMHKEGDARTTVIDFGAAPK